MSSTGVVMSTTPPNQIAGESKRWPRKPRPTAPEWVLKLVGDPSDRLTVDAFAVASGVNDRTVRRWVREQRIKAHRLGGRIYLDRASVELFLAEGGLSDAAAG